MPIAVALRVSRFRIGLTRCSLAVFLGPTQPAGLSSSPIAPPESVTIRSPAARLNTSLLIRSYNLLLNWLRLILSSINPAREPV